MLKAFNRQSKVFNAPGKLWRVSLKKAQNFFPRIFLPNTLFKVRLEGFIVSRAYRSCHHSSW